MILKSFSSIFKVLKSSCKLTVHKSSVKSKEKSVTILDKIQITDTQGLNTEYPN